MRMKQICDNLMKSLSYLTVGSWAEFCASRTREVDGGAEKLSSLKALSGLNSWKKAGFFVV